MNNGLGILAAFGGGIVLGAALGILLAPEKGSETRQRIKRFVKKESEALQEQLSDFLKSKGIECSPEEISEIWRS